MKQLKKSWCLYYVPLKLSHEKIIEINCHGGILTINRILELTMTYGARMAEPGEYTKRAF